MFISPHSELHTVLLWGDRWYFAGTPEPRVFPELTHAAEVLAAHFAQERRPVRLRLIFQPDTLETAEAPCPNGSRAALRAALAGEFPALGDRDCAWGHEPVVGAGDRFSTSLYFETTPGLFQLINRLAQFGFTVESAWPLATYLCALPDEWSETGAMTVLATEPSRALAYHHPSDGPRAVLTWSDDDTGTRVAAWLNAELDRCPSQPVLIIASETDADLQGIPEVEHVTFAEALARPVVLPKNHPAQLLPPAPFVTTQRVVLAASLALLLAGAWSGLAYARQYVSWQNQAQADAAEKQILQAEITRCHANAPEIAMLRASLAGPGSSPPASELLEKLGSTIPREIALRRVRIEQSHIRVEGHVAPGTEPDALTTWRIRLGGPHWSFDPTPSVSAAGEFNLTGVFTP